MCFTEQWAGSGLGRMVGTHSYPGRQGRGQPMGYNVRSLWKEHGQWNRAVRLSFLSHSRAIVMIGPWKTPVLLFSLWRPGFRSWDVLPQWVGGLWRCQYSPTGKLTFWGTESSDLQLLCAESSSSPPFSSAFWRVSNFFPQDLERGREVWVLSSEILVLQLFFGNRNTLPESLGNSRSSSFAGESLLNHCAV